MPGSLERVGLPMDFLEGYPLAAVVLSEDLESGIQIVWSNDHWESVAGDGKLEEMVDDRSYRSIQSWNVEHPPSVITLTFRSSVSLRFARTTLPTSSTHILTCLDDTPRPTSPRTPTPTLGQSRQTEVRTTDCRQLLQTTDWSQTPLGPRSTWSPVIETMISVVMASPTQDSLWLGPEFTMIYNQNYSQIVHHPQMFGRSAKVKEAWGPVWDSVYGLIERCLTLGEPCHRVNDLLLYRKGPKGHFVEKYHTWSFVPIFDSDGKTPLGLFNPTVETTASVLAKRRQETLRDLSEQTLLAKTQEEYWGDIPTVLKTNPHDVPFAACYSLIEQTGEKVRLKLESTIGIPDQHPSTPLYLDITLGPEHKKRPTSIAMSSPTLSAISTNGTRIRYSEDKSSWPIAKALATRQCVVMEDCTEMIKGYPLRQWDNLPESAIILPFCSETSSAMPSAVMILGLNLQCPLDPAYEDWIYNLRANLTSSLSSVKSIEEEQARMMETERMARAKTAWFQGAAHDLRSPLTLVAGPLDDVLRTHLTGSQRHWLTIAQRNVGRIQRLVNSLLDFSRIEAGRMKGHFVPMDLNRFITDLAAFFQPAIEKKRIGFKLNIQPFEGTVSVDPVLFETVVTNLLSNAVKYTEKGSITLAVWYDTNVNIAITDTGCGIPAAELQHVTDRYHRATTAINRGVEGTGIGLALSQEIVRLHGGDLLIESQAVEDTNGPHGSTFTVVIPLVDRENDANDAPANTFGVYGKQLAAEALYNTQFETSSTTSTIDTTNESSDRSEGLFFDPSDVLLLVDDSAEIRDYIRRIFSPFCQVVEASNGLEALEVIKTQRPDLILSDMMMPKMNGQELLAAVRSDPKTRSIPMILLSAATDEELRVAALIEYSAEDFLLKPFKPKELLARVNLHMQMGKRMTYLESQFAQREQELRLLSDACPSGIIRADSDGHLLYVNPAWRSYCGMPPQEDMNNWPNYIDSTTRQTLEGVLTEIQNGKAETSIAWKWLNGKTVSATFIRLDSVDENLTGMIGCLQDITYQEEKLFEAERRRIEAEQAKRQQEMLVDMTSHEIRTPVSAILQCSALVKENLGELRGKLVKSGKKGYVVTSADLDEIEQDLEALESIYQCGLVQERIASDVLSLARVQLDMLSLHHVQTDIRASAKKLVSAFTSEARAKKIDLSLEIGSTIERANISHIKTDHVRLGQIVTNLIANAVRFTSTSPKREIKVTYEISFVPPLDDDCAVPDTTHLPDRPKDGTPVWLFVSVRDTGPGLAEEEQKKLFKRFSQGNEMIHSQYGGSGLGLFICRKISELLGGRIEVKSKLGEGSVFRFFIQTYIASPQASAKDIEASHTSELRRISRLSLRNGAEDREDATKDDSLSQSDPSQGPLKAAADQLSGPKPGDSDFEFNKEETNGNPTNSVLIVEDNIINQTVLKRQLTKAGWKCDGREALDMLYKRAEERVPPYDILLMDLEMPVMNGITCVKEIRQAERRGDIVYQLVVALTGNARQGQIDQALEAGMDDVMIKPYRLDELQKKMRALIEVGREELDRGRRTHGGRGVNRRVEQRVEGERINEG